MSVTTFRMRGPVGFAVAGCFPHLGGPTPLAD